MGLIREPKGIDLIVGPSELTEKDKNLISEIIENYRRTGKTPGKIKKTRRLTSSGSLRKKIIN